MGDRLEMSDKELCRLKVLEMLNKRLIKHRIAAEQLEVTTRQTKRLLKEYRRIGDRCVISNKRGKPSNRRHDDDFKRNIEVLIRDKYADFGPKFAAEKLEEEHGITISKESLRKYMVEWGMWRASCGKCYNIHQQRPRRECFGELVQIDGSPHAWFEDRGKKCCLIVFIDDATSKILSMHFVPTESTQAYFECTKKYIEKHGIPWAFYSDRHGIFKVNKIGAEGKETQFGRGMRELDIKIIFAHSPQAKGRVERANRTLQDRLVKELRLRNISDIDAANEYVEEFMEKHNKKFGKTPLRDVDVHRKNLPPKMVLEAILCERYYRKLSLNLEFSFECSTYQAITQDMSGLRGAQAPICRFANGELKIWHRNSFIACNKFGSRRENGPIASGKEINSIVDKLLVANASCGKKIEAWRDVPFLRMVNKSQQNASVLM